jgi:hypothetical protein
MPRSSVLAGAVPDVDLAASTELIIRFAGSIPGCGAGTNTNSKSGRHPVRPGYSARIRKKALALVIGIVTCGCAVVKIPLQFGGANVVVRSTTNGGVPPVQFN